MAKAKSIGESKKVTFGRRKKGKAKKAYSKYEEKPKKYRGQGRQDFCFMKNEKSYIKKGHFEEIEGEEFERFKPKKSEKRPKVSKKPARKNKWDSLK